MCEVLLILNKKYSDNLRRWLHDIVTVQNLILPNVTEDMKSMFFKRVLRLFHYFSKINIKIKSIIFLFIVYREKSNKKALQDAVREFSFICRGLIEMDPYIES